jgi:hypothetical protein
VPAAIRPFGIRAGPAGLRGSRDLHLSVADQLDAECRR